MSPSAERSPGWSGGRAWRVGRWVGTSASAARVSGDSAAGSMREGSAVVKGPVCVDAHVVSALVVEEVASTDAGAASVPIAAAATGAGAAGGAAGAAAEPQSERACGRAARLRALRWDCERVNNS